MNTKESILDTALQLFNQQSTGPVSTNHIAEALGISPGNLYYHYRNKQEIIRALFERLFAAWDAVFALPADRLPTLDDLHDLVRANFTTLWAYRFAHRELLVLLRADADLKLRFLEVRQRGFEGFRQLFEAFAAAGVIAPARDAQDVDDMVDLCWLISEFWLNSLEVSGLEVDGGNLERGVQLMLRVIQV